MGNEVCVFVFSVLSVFATFPHTKNKHYFGKFKIMVRGKKRQTENHECEARLWHSEAVPWGRARHGSPWCSGLMALSKLFNEPVNISVLNPSFYQPSKGEPPRFTQS